MSQLMLTLALIAVVFATSTSAYVKHAHVANQIQSALLKAQQLEEEVLHISSKHSWSFLSLEEPITAETSCDTIIASLEPSHPNFKKVLGAGAKGKVTEIVAGATEVVTYAVKTIKDDKTARAERVAADVDCPHVLKPIKVCTVEEPAPVQPVVARRGPRRRAPAAATTTYIVYPFAGTDVAKTLATAALSATNVQKIVKNVAEGLKCLHDTFRLVHLDIKPGNIAMTDAGEVTLIDVGALTGIGQELPIEDVVTPHYFALPNGVLSSAQDMYPLGMTAVEMICGDNKFPYTGEGGPTSVMGLVTINADATLSSDWSVKENWKNQDCYDRIFALKTTNVNLYNMIVAMLSKDPAKRPTAAVVFETLSS